MIEAPDLERKRALQAVVHDPATPLRKKLDACNELQEPVMLDELASRYADETLAILRVAVETAVKDLHERQALLDEVERFE